MDLKSWNRTDPAARATQEGAAAEAQLGVVSGNSVDQSLVERYATIKAVIIDDH